MSDIDTSFCVPGSVTDRPDERVIRKFEEYKRLQLDPGYKKVLPYIHGGIPVRQYFATQEGNIRRIGRFLTFLDEHSTLAGPPQSTRDNCSEFDARVWDLGVPYITACDPDFFLGAERIVPFGALFTMNRWRGMIDPNDAESSLHNFDLPVLDTVCFDRSTTPHSVLVCDTAAAAGVADECFDDPEYIVDYSTFTEMVASSFTEFLGLLKERPHADEA